MSDVVLKAIHTVNRRLRVGDPVSEGDDLSPHSFSDLKSRGFIGSGEPDPSRFADALSGDDD